VPEPNCSKRRGVVAIETMLAVSDALRYGNAASTMRTNPQDIEPADGPARRPRCSRRSHRRWHWPPRCRGRQGALAASATHVATADPSLRSTAVPWTVPLSDNSATATSTSFLPRAPRATLAPSSSSRPAMALPIPRLPPEDDGLLARPVRDPLPRPRSQEIE